MDSVTPTAGMLARELARYLDLEFWETTSVHELETTDWMPRFYKKEKVLVICDMFDTGSLTRRIVRKVGDRGGVVMAVLALARNRDVDIPTDLSEYIFISGTSVTLGSPDTAASKAALELQQYFEIDPHTLKPVKPDSFLIETTDHRRKEFMPFVQAGVVEVGHFIHGGHHYPVYFNLHEALSVERVDNSPQRIPPESTFRQGGGLETQRNLLRRLGNDLMGKSENGVNSFIMRLQRIRVNNSPTYAYEK